MGFSAGDITERFQWTFPIVISPTDPDTLYATSQHVWKSTNEGQSWQRISPDLTRHDPSTLGPSGGPITLDQTGVETYATVFTLAPSPLNGQVMWAGSDDGLVHVTRDGGGQWNKVTPKDLPDFTRISLIEASPHDAGTAYLAGNRYQKGDRGPYVYRTRDYGATWTKIVTGIPADDFAAHRPRRQAAQRLALPRHRNRRLRQLRRRGAVAVASARDAGDAGAWDRDQGQRPGDRHTRPLVLHPRQHRPAPSGLARDHERTRRPVRSVRRDPFRLPRRHRGLLPEASRRQGDDRIQRRTGTHDPELHWRARGQGQGCDVSVTGR